MEQIIHGIVNRIPQEIVLTRHSGEKKTFLIRKCDGDDYEEIMALQKKISDAVHNPEIYSMVDGEEILESLQLDNRITPRNYGNLVGYPPERQARCVSMEITIVDEPCRGYGMQRLFVQLREGVARHMGATEAMVTIGPDNKYSLNNLLASGYEIIDTRPLYEGAMRHILRKEL